ncbi:putative uncharacterized protein [Janthinobacterium agaricidamnosum NBRC 102515 = DSM 9628]|uniref:Chalcone isomerase domain-containing protein n=2 Tax=Janthinobacterium agaricidamnosum TaxID=55508 RepID=W0VCS2_9BURK|nr:chalcone isomerase family protein [Janthinobacterium agaricidamnosum]CDG85102.1 putative uncharacterized protein [Janthinobacterium agaricidamnosum NBRC 102515 = DSM 9628]
MCGLLLRTLLAMPALAGAAPAYVEQEVPQARLAGQGSFTWLGLTIYQAQLWVGPQGYRDAAPDAAPFVLDLRYARALNGQKIAEASYDQMKKIGAGSEAQRQQWLASMQRIFPDVTEGQNIAGVQLAGGGARFYLDGARLADVPDPAFARAFFAIWLAPHSTAPKLRSALLLDAAPRP